MGCTGDSLAALYGPSFSRPSGRVSELRGCRRGKPPQWPQNLAPTRSVEANCRCMLSISG